MLRMDKKERTPKDLFVSQDGDLWLQGGFYCVATWVKMIYHLVGLLNVFLSNSSENRW